MLREILERVGYYKNNSELAQNLFLKKCQTIIDFLSALNMCDYKTPEEKDLAVKEDDPFVPKIEKLIVDYRSAITDFLDMLVDIFYKEFSKIKNLSESDSVFIQTRLAKIIHPAIADMVDTLEVGKAEFLLATLEEMLSLTRCATERLPCDKKSVLLKLITVTKTSRAFNNFRDFLIKHYDKK
jgi:hypothetical protein